MIFGLFKQRTTTLSNGEKVKEGDTVFFINSDGVRCEDKIRRRHFDCTHADTGERLKKGTLYFWNNSFNPIDYNNLATR